MGGVDLFDDALEEAVGGEDECAAERAEHGLAVHLLLAPGPECLKHLRGRIREETERQIVLGAEAGVGFHAVFADTDHVIAGRSESGIVVAERACFRRAP